MHHAHLDELSEAVVRLNQAAREYTYTDEDVMSAMRGYREQFDLGPLDG